MASYQERISMNLKNMGSSKEEWRSVPIKGVAEVENNKGKIVKMPLFDFPKNYSKAPTLFPVGSNQMNCELCGKTPIAVAYWLQNDLHKWTLLVGSECVTKFESGASGKDNLREYQLKEAELLAEATRKTASIIKEKTSYLNNSRDYYGNTTTTRRWNSLYVGESTAYRESSKVNELFKEGKLNPLLKEKGGDRQTIYWFYVYDSLPVFIDKYDNSEKSKREKDLLSWYKRNKKKATEMVNSFQSLYNVIYPDEQKLDLIQINTTSDNLTLLKGGNIKTFNYSIGGL